MFYQTGFCLSLIGELARMIFSDLFSYKKKATHALSRPIAKRPGQF